jgi:hypothetical protein
MIMNKQEFLTFASIQAQTLDLWLEQRWLIPEQTSAGLNFSDMDVARAHLIRDLKADFGTTRVSTSSFISWISSTACAERSSSCTMIFRELRTSDVLLIDG